MHYSMLQCVAVCRSSLQYVAVYCSVLQCIVVCCNVLKCATNTALEENDKVCCNVWHCNALSRTVIYIFTAYTFFHIFKEL